jgi:pyruvate dehydrogenase (quinone)/pyruvate decarboxylase
MHGIDRRDLILAGAVGAALVGTATARAQPAATQLAAAQAPDGQMNTSDILVETLIAWGATHAFGIVGDGINPFIEALRKRQDRITFVGVRHEEAAAFMACAFAKHTGKIGVCLATTGPGAVHLMNGLYDAKFDNAPVVAITGTTFRDLQGMHFMQGVDSVKLMENVALFDEQVNGPDHAVLIGNRACRAAMAGRGVAHLALPKDVQGMKLSADKPSTENHGGRSSAAWSPPIGAPPVDQLRAAADILNAGRKVAILAGAGCLDARRELQAVADTLGAPVAKALLGKAVLADDDPLTTGGIGHLGTQPSSWAMHACDTVLILGSMMPWLDYYPKPGQARGVQIDLKPEHLGVKYPVEIGLTGDMRSTLAALQPLLVAKVDRSFLAEAQSRMRDWNGLLDRVAATQKGAKLRPQTVCRALGKLAPDNAVFSMDCGANTHFAARMIPLREDQRWSGTGTLVSMASGVPYAIAASFAYPDRPSIAVVGDGGFAMLMAELSTAVLHRRNIKVMVLNNDSLGEVKFEQRELGNPEYGCALGHIEFATFAEACGAQGFRATTLDELEPAIKAWLAAPGVAVLDVQVDPEEEAQTPEKLSV